MNDEELITTYVDGRMSEQSALRLRRACRWMQACAGRSRSHACWPTNHARWKWCQRRKLILPHDFGKAVQPVTPAPHVDLRRWFFRLSSVAAAVVFMFAVAFDTLRNALPATPVPAAAPMSATMQEAQAPESRHCNEC